MILILSKNEVNGNLVLVAILPCKITLPRLANWAALSSELAMVARVNWFDKLTKIKPERS
jgi:hypothetical protein